MAETGLRVSEPVQCPKKVDYGSTDYWNARYADQDMGGAFDWLFEFDDVKEIISQLIEKDSHVLMVGAGNANFSRDMFYAGYQKITNIDISDVVIATQKELFPQMCWEEMDARQMPYENGTIPCVLDKSLIDTMLCYNKSRKATKDFIKEVYRVLEPGGVYISFSLHDVGEVVRYYMQHDWLVSPFRILNRRWSPAESHRSVSHSLIICRKKDAFGVLPNNLSLTHVLSEADYEECLNKAKDICFDHYISAHDTSDLMGILDAALFIYQKQTFSSKPIIESGRQVDHDSSAVVINQAQVPQKTSSLDGNTDRS